MIKIENIDVFNFEGAFRGMRNPLESHHLSDSKIIDGEFVVGEKDLELAIKLVRAGSDHSKFTRQIFVSMDITAPIYWWKEMDTYKVATVANSESTIHKLSSTPISLEKFSIETDILDENELDILNQYINMLDHLRKESGNAKVWRALIQLLPESWNQKRTWSADYAVLRNIYFARKSHKLSEWHEFCHMIEELPYSELIIKGEN